MPAEADLGLDRDLRGLDALEMPRSEATPRILRIWRAAWPKLAAAGVSVAIWQLIAISGFRPDFVLPDPAEVFSTLADLARTTNFWQAVATTMQRAAVGFGAALALGTLVGLAVSQSQILRSAVGSLITGFQTFPSIAWFPLAILIFGLSEAAIFFVIILGAAPSIANGLISGIDHIPPIILRAGSILGARGPISWSRVVLPAALPGYVAGLKQGWAFSWRSLMAGELLVIIGERPSIGVRLHFARELSDAAGLQAMMIVVLIVGLLMDGLFFGTLERRIRRNRGLVATK